MNKVYYQVTVETIVSDPESGKVRKSKEQVLVDAQSPTEAEARATAVYGTEPVEFEITGATKSRIIKVIESEQ